MSDQEKYNKYLETLFTEFKTVKGEIETLCWQYKNSCNNPLQLSIMVKESIGDDYINFIDNYSHNPAYLGIKDTVLQKLAIKTSMDKVRELTSLPYEYSKSLLQD